MKLKLKVFNKPTLFGSILFLMFGIAFAMFALFEVSSYMQENHPEIMFEQEKIDWEFVKNAFERIEKESNSLKK